MKDLQDGERATEALSENLSPYHARLRYDDELLNLGKDLLHYTTSLSPAESPSEWLAANKSYVLAVIGVRRLLFNCRQIGQHGVKNFGTYISECIDTRGRIYLRFIVYTLAHLASCSGQHRLFHELLGQIKIWDSWDDVRLLLKHREISDYLWACLRTSKNPSFHHCDSAEWLQNLLSIDIAGICTHTTAILQDDTIYKTFLSCRDDDAQILVNLLQAYLDLPNLEPLVKHTFIRALFRLSGKSGRYPDSLVIRDIVLDSKAPMAAGQFGDVWKEEIEGHPIAVKAVRVYVKSEVDKIVKAFSKEAVTWAQLFHPNILPFYGIYQLNENCSRLCFISPWMENGTIIQFLERRPDANRVSLLCDVAHGLDYLHGLDPPVVHGDLKGANVLVTSSGRACLADFGLATTAASKVLPWSCSSFRSGGTWRWQAPELLVSEVEDTSNVMGNSTASDIYAFACVCYEVLTGNLPFHSIPQDFSVVLAVKSGKRPPKPSGVWIGNTLWDLIERCWRQQREQRPSAKETVEELQVLSNVALRNNTQCDWDTIFMGQFRSNLHNHPFCMPQRDAVLPDVQSFVDEQTLFVDGPSSSGLAPHSNPQNGGKRKRDRDGNRSSDHEAQQIRQPGPSLPLARLSKRPKKVDHSRSKLADNPHPSSLIPATDPRLPPANRYGNTIPLPKLQSTTSKADDTHFNFDTSLFTPSILDRDFERDFGKWFNPDNVDDSRVSDTDHNFDTLPLNDGDLNFERDFGEWFTPDDPLVPK